MCVYCNRSQMTSWYKEQKSTRRSRVAWLLFYKRCDVCDLLQNTDTVYWFIEGFWFKWFIEGFWGHEKRKTSALTWIWRPLCVCPLIDHCRPEALEATQGGGGRISKKGTFTLLGKQVVDALPLPCLLAAMPSKDTGYSNPRPQVACPQSRYLKVSEMF